jgi:hypothetical protein
MNCVGHLWAGCGHSNLTIEIYRGDATGHPWLTTITVAG